MSILNTIKSEFIEIIEWVDHDPNLLMWKFPDEDKAIKNGAKLTVREGQLAMFLNEGKIADIFHAGMHTLSTANTPILSTLKGWKFGFESPFKADIYFFNTRQYINNKWGTPAPILMPDVQFGQVRIRAFGSFDLKIADVPTFYKQYCGAFPQLTIFELQNQLRDFVAPKFGEILAQEKIPVVEVAGNITTLSKKVEPLLKPYFLQLGVELTQFIITSVTLPDEVLAHYDKITNMNMVTDMNKFAAFNTASAIGNSDSGMSDAVKQGAMLNAMLQQTQQQQQIPAVQPTPTDDITDKLKKIKVLFEQELIDEQEYKLKKEELLKLL
jgi:membrane protease subunit (stomatin/prohibitin family)